MMGRTLKNPKLERARGTAPETLVEQGQTFRLLRTYRSHRRAVKRATAIAAQYIVVVVEPIGRFYALYVPVGAKLAFDWASLPEQPMRPRATYWRDDGHLLLT